RHDTKRAHVIAPSHNRDERCDTVRVQTYRTDVGIRLFPRQTRPDTTRPAVGLTDPSRQVAIRLRPGDLVDQLFLLQQLGFQPFGHATQNAYQHSRLLLLEPLDVIQAVANRLLGLLTYGARIQEHDVGIVNVGSRVKTLVSEYRCHNLAVREVHLASVTLNV